MDARLDRLRNRLAVSGTIARLACGISGARGGCPATPKTRKRYAEAGRLLGQARAHSSGVEHSPYKRGAGGSNPPAPTGLCRSAASLNLARLISSG